MLIPILRKVVYLFCMSKFHEKFSIWKISDIKILQKIKHTYENILGEHRTYDIAKLYG